MKCEFCHIEIPSWRTVLFLKKYEGKTFHFCCTGHMAKFKHFTKKKPFWNEIKYIHCTKKGLIFEYRRIGLKKTHFYEHLNRW